MTPEIITRDDFIVVGIRTVLEMDARTTGTLWKNEFLPRHGDIKGSRGGIKGSDTAYYAVFNTLPGNGKGGRYEYVAGVVSDLEDIPVGMVGWVVPGGSYASASATGLPGIGDVCRALIAEWLPGSGYTMAASPLFAHTTHPHPDSPEAVWTVNIPVATPEELETLREWGI